MSEHEAQHPQALRPEYEIPKPDGGYAKITRTWTNKQVQQIMADALAIVEELDPPEDLRLQSFQTALTLTGQMTALEPAVRVVPGGVLGADKGRMN